ncbi:MAG: RNA polymerase sigma factor FliA [Gammaproteobacteria bacterium]|nr:RNA polymerase sigma factor FliA [Gammaproteobacteria bacterium]
MDTDSLKEPISDGKTAKPVKTELDEQAKETLVKTHALLIKRIAYHLLGRLPRSIQLEDLMQAGMVGLLEAAAHYDKTKGASFETYAGIRIRGHMLDEVRRNDWVPRSVYRNARLIAKAVREVENTLSRDAKDKEIAKELGVNLDEYYHMLHDANGAHLYGFDDLGVTDDSLKGDGAAQMPEPHERVLKDEFKDRLAKVIEGLPEKERLVLSLYYEHELNLKEIGDLLDVTESRVSQIHSQATHRIRARISE